MRAFRSVVRIVAAVTLTAVAGLVVPAEPAAAAACPTANGVTVVVDFNQLGGGVQQVCDPDGGGHNGEDLFNANGFHTEPVQTQPDFVCRINGKPGAEEDACQRTPPADAYWGLWWSDGESGDWTYSSRSARSLTIPDGGYVAFSWQGGGGSSPPSAQPTPRPDEPEPSDSPSEDGPGDGNGGGKSGGPGAGEPSQTAPSDTPSASPSEPTTPGKGDRSDKPGKQDDDKADTKGDKADDQDDEAAEPEESSTESVEPTSSAEPPASGGDDGLPVWVGPVGIGALFAVAGGVALVRRRTSS